MEKQTQVDFELFVEFFFRDGFIGRHMQYLILSKLGRLQLKTGNSETLVKNHVEQVPRKTTHKLYAVSGRANIYKVIN